jgi:hypothetical protein
MRGSYCRSLFVDRLPYLAVEVLEACDVKVGDGAARVRVRRQCASERLSALMQSDEAGRLPEVRGTIFEVL